MPRALTCKLLVIVWIASCVIQSMAAAGMANAAAPAGAASPAFASGPHAMHAQANAADIAVHPGGCNRADTQNGVDEGAICCPSMCQTVATVEPQIPATQLRIAQIYEVWTPGDPAPVPVPISERPPQFS